MGTSDHHRTTSLFREETIKPHIQEEPAMDPSKINGDFECPLEPEEPPSDTVLRIKNPDGPAGINREVLTQQRLGKTMYKLKLSHVQYGTYGNEPAVLVAFGLELIFPDGTSDRVTELSLEVEFVAAPTNAVAAVKPTRRRKGMDAGNDPSVKLYAPRSTMGPESKTVVTNRWHVSMPMSLISGWSRAQTTASLRLDAGVARETKVERSSSWSIKSFSHGDDAHASLGRENVVSWCVTEDASQKSGVPPGALSMMIAVVTMPPDGVSWVKMEARVSAKVALSLNPMRMVQKRDDATFLDGKKEKGGSLVPAKTEGKLADFEKITPTTWEELVAGQ